LSSVDVIVPCYNYGRYLRQCVDSVLRQAGVDVRVLVINDASPDNTAEVAAALASQDSRVGVIHHSKNRGHINTYNEGIEWASADYMLLLSADDYLLPDALERATAIFEAHPEVGLIFGNAIELSDDGREAPLVSTFSAVSSSTACIFSGSDFIELSGIDNQVVTCTAVVRTGLQKLLGGYRHELPHAGDMEMWLRFAAHASVGFIPSYQGVYRRHSANMSTAYYSVSDTRLVYTNSGRLADLRQRKQAFDYFWEHCDRIPQWSELFRQRLYMQLAVSAVGHASAAFNDGLVAESKELSDFAAEIYPRIKNSTAWMKFACKRWVGARAWRAFRPAVATLGAAKPN